MTVDVDCRINTDQTVLFQVSALLGRIPSAVGYQPTLATDMGTMQERITTTKKGSITSVQVRAKLGSFHISTFLQTADFHAKIANLISGYLCAC